MKILILISMLCSIPFSLVASNEEIIPFTKKSFVESCDQNGKWKEFQVNNEPAQRTYIKLSKIKKVNVESMHGEDKFQTEVDGVPFKSEIFVNKIKEEYLLTLIIRSGEGTKRAGATWKETKKRFFIIQTFIIFR